MGKRVTRRFELVVGLKKGHKLTPNKLRVKKKVHAPTVSVPIRLVVANYVQPSNLPLSHFGVGFTYRTYSNLWSVLFVEISETKQTRKGHNARGMRSCPI